MIADLWKYEILPFVDRKIYNQLLVVNKEIYNYCYSGKLNLYHAITIDKDYYINDNNLNYWKSDTRQLKLVTSLENYGCPKIENINIYSYFTQYDNNNDYGYFKITNKLYVNLVNRDLFNKKYNYVLIDCGYLYRLKEKKITKIVNDLFSRNVGMKFLNLNLVKQYTSCEIYQDFIYVELETFHDAIIICQYLMTFDHCEFFDFKNLFHKEDKYDNKNILVMYFDTESG